MIKDKIERRTTMSTLNRELPYINAFGTVDISTCKDVDSALITSGLNWDVQSKPLFDEMGHEYPKFRANVRETDNALLGITTESYRIVQNAEAFDFVNALADEGGFEFDRAGQFRNGAAIWLMGKLPTTQILGDDIENNLVFVNSHDGSSGVKVMMTPVRVACYNMLNLALKKATRVWAAKHTRSIYNRIEEAKYTLGLANNYMKALDEEADILANKKITEAQLEAIFDSMFPIDKNKDSERKINNVTLLKKNFFACYNESDIAQFKGTVWGAINAMADLVDHSSPTRNTADYYNNAWNKLIQGHPVLDTFYKLSK